MSLFNKISRKIRGASSPGNRSVSDSGQRRCRFELLEERRVLSADPVVAGVTFLESDAGLDTTPDVFEVSFVGGEETTQLTQFVINGDQDGSGDISDGDVFFDVDDSQPGAGEHHAFEFDADNSSGVTQSDIQGVSVSDDGLRLTVDVDNFVAGDVLAFTIDVDEVESFRFDRITSGVEFEGSIFETTFIDQHNFFEQRDIATEVTIDGGFVQQQQEGIFFDEFDNLFNEGETVGEGTLNLEADNESNQADRTAGAVDAFDLVPQPITVSGTVFHDDNLDCIHDGTEEGIEGVTIELQEFNADTGEYVTVASTQTDANGDYIFGEDLGLLPGEYRLVELQPEGFLDVGAVAGSEGGVVQDDADGNQNIIGDINIELGGTDSVNNNFKEITPGSISGFVSLGEPGQPKLSSDDPNFQGVEGATIQLLNEDGDIIATTQTDASGRYEFGDLPPGTYSIVEVQPEGLLDGPEAAGFVDGQQQGIVGSDRFDNIVLGAGSEAVEFNFCEHEPASIKGTVYHDRNNNGRQDPGEEGIEGVVIELFDSDGNLVRTTTTDENGDYCFDDIPGGEYTILETQPEDFIDGQESVGSLGGTTSPDGFTVVVNGGDEGVNYDFGELQPASISGFVHGDNNEDGIFDTAAGEEGLANVTLDLLDANGAVIATTVTDENGFYEFTGLEPGTYSVRETQPDGFFSVGETPGADGNGEALGDLIANIVVGSGDNLTDFNFCEVASAEIHGRVFEDGPAFETEDGNVPENFRDLRDGIFTPGVDTPLANVRLELFHFFDPNSNQIEPRPVLISEVLAEFYPDIDASDPNATVFVETGPDGEYWFQGLRPGSYVVVETQPEGFIDANDIPGPTTNGNSGVAFNSDSEVNGAISALTSTFSDSQLQDVVANIVVDANGVSTQNNFTEVRALTLPPAPEPPAPLGNPNPANSTNPGIPANPVRPGLGLTGLPGLAGAQTGNFISIIGAAGSTEVPAEEVAEEEPGDFSWHLSVVNGGSPRAAGTEANESESVWLQASFLSDSDWTRFETENGLWTFTTTTDGKILPNAELGMQFGTIGGIPLAGDFDGNGTDEVAIFIDGYWMIDLNHNGRWDKDDLLAKLGDSEDRPVVGDWDGDGKDDIGIYGPMWEHDLEAIENEPGLPNPDNEAYTSPKNIPPKVADATNGSRVMKLTSFGRQQANVVDHVFGLDEEDKIPVAGDWNGNGIRSIGTFRDGLWELDVNGDGRFDDSDESIRFGRAGDVPLVGDFNGDGVEEIAVYRNGSWIIDSNGNRELEITDRTFEMGGIDDKPVVGDWDGDGIDEPAIYSEQSVNEFN